VIGKSAARGDIVRYESTTPRSDAVGDVDAMSLWAGQGVALVHRIQPAAEIVREIVDETRNALQRVVPPVGG
jgi:NAD(P)H-dependent flavin oxidoreductase YrpB (nitropropane dioxygenase family)